MNNSTQPPKIKIDFMHARELLTSRLGRDVPIFPCHPTTKKPLTTHGFRDASTDPKQIRQWWTRHPDAMVGMPTGPASGVFVVDCDMPKHGEPASGLDTFMALCKEHGGFDDNTMVVKTPSGGYHIYYRYLDGYDIGNSTSKIAPLVDVRGDGGYVIVQPSLNGAGEYRWLTDFAPAQAPDWLVSLVSRPRPGGQPTAAPSAVPYIIGIESGYGAKAMADELATLSAAVKGTRNAALNRAAVKLGGVVAGGVLDAAEVVEVLHATALSIGLDERETAKTIRSGMAAGCKNPRRPAPRTLIDQTELWEPGQPGPDQAEDSAPAIEPIQFWIPSAKEDSFPTYALPDTLRAVVDEYAAYGQQPGGLIATSALAALSLTCQGHADVSRDPVLVGPSGCFFMVIAESGERKTSADNFFSKPIVEWLDEYRARIAPEIKRQKAEWDAWEARRTGLVKAISQAAKGASKSGKSVETLQGELFELAQDEPKVQATPKMLFYEFNAASIGSALTHGHPVAAIWTAEGGSFVGNNGNQKEAFMCTLAMLNQLWDSGRYENDRKTVEATAIRGARVSACLMMQPRVFKMFSDNQEGLARDIGLFSRFLLCRPKSTIGERPYTEPGPMPSYGRYCTKIRGILDRPLPIDADGALSPEILTMDAEAFSVWRKYYDAVERSLAEGKQFEAIKDLGSKAAENVARLAANFHVFEGRFGQIQADHVQMASAIVDWYLNEALRIFGLIEPTPAERNAVSLLKWMLDGHERVTARDVHIYGPGGVRCPKSRDGAIDLLIETGWITRDGKKFALTPGAKKNEVIF